MEPPSHARSDARPSPSPEATHAGEGIGAVIVGGSAGSVGVVCQLFATLAPETGLCYVIALHMPRGHPSHLVDLLQRETAMRVLPAAEGMTLEADRVYVVPPGLALAWTGQRLALVAPATPTARPCGIDLTMRAVAEACPARCIGVLLSGAGTDGADGLRRVCALGGEALVQDPAEAEVPGMPLAGLSSGVPSRALSVGRIAAYLNRRPRTRGDESGEDPSIGARSASGERRPRDPAVHAACVPGARSLRPVTGRFFAEPGAYASLQAVIGGVFASRGRDEVFKAWVPACGHGPEAYSLAMVLVERVAALGEAAPMLRIIATDADPAAIDAARRGCYDALDAMTIPAARLAQHFVRDAAGYRVRASLRAQIVFGVHDLFADAPFSALDLVWCPRLLERVGSEEFERTLHVFEYALRPGGLLAAGTRGFSTEDAARFETVGLELRRRRRLPQPAVLAAHAVPLRRAPAFEPARSRAELHLRLIERYAPPSLLVDAQLRVLHLSSGAARLLQLDGGEPQLALPLLLPPELRLPLNEAIEEALRTRQPAERLDLAADVGGHALRLDLHVLGAADIAPGCLLIQLNDLSTALPGAATLAWAARLRAAAGRSRGEQRIDGMLAAMPLDAYTLDLDKRFVLASPGVERRFGLTSAEIAGRSLREAGCSDALATRLETAAQRVIDTAVATGSGGDDLSLRPVAEGNLEYGFAPLLAADGAVEALLGWSRRLAAFA